MMMRYGILASIASLLIVSSARADTVADWAEKTTEIATDGPTTIRTMALAQSAVYEAVNAITLRYPRDHIDLGPAKGASLAAAIAAASQAVLLHEAPALRLRIETAYVLAIEGIADTDARTHGIAVGVRAAADILEKHKGDIGNPEPYRPLTAPNVYVPTTLPLGVAVAQQRPWFMKSAAQFRPGPPPELTSDTWVRDYNETKTIGALNSTVRTPEQTAMARFWATALPDVYLGVLRSVDSAPGRDETRNARFYAAVMAGLNESEVAVFEAKYRYQFWRPITAIRNGDQDGNPATERDPGWLPMITTPVQPEYPCGHCILAAVVAGIVHADVGRDPMPTLRAISNTAPGEVREWKRTEDLAHEVAEARIYDGVHFRSSAQAGTHMGEQIAALVAAAFDIR